MTGLPRGKSEQDGQIINASSVLFSDWVSSVKISHKVRVNTLSLLDFTAGSLRRRIRHSYTVYASRKCIFSMSDLFNLLNNFPADINYKLKILYSNDHQRHIINRWRDLKITTFGVCTRLDQAGSDWERAACLCLTVKENLLL